ncbi:ATP-dependent DNA ligase [Pseudoxanthomonas indica]|nr:ATP-dependent DNA ligase [Pseudoxanthomonas indica]
MLFGGLALMLSGLPGVRAADAMALLQAHSSDRLPAMRLLQETLGPGEARQPAAPGMMLATPMRGGIDVRDYWISEKLDGVRARWDGRQLITRGGARISVPAWFVRGWPDLPLDGELWLGRGRFEATSGLVRRYREDAAAWRQMKFMVFDAPAQREVFDVRLRRLQRAVTTARVPWLQVIPQHRLADMAQLQAKLREVVGAGGEGLMLHHAQGRYVAGRSLHLLKLKPHLESDARVVGHVPGKGKYAGMLGALSVQASDGRRFRLGSGFSDAQRAQPPPLGSVVTYRYDGLTRRGLPRFARFLRVRDEEPLRPP